MRRKEIIYGQKKKVYVEREPSEIKKRVVIITKDQSKLHSTEGICVSLGGGSFVSAFGLEGGGTWGGTSLSCQNRLEGHPHARGT